MQECDAIQKVDGESATRQDVPTDKNIVWTFKGGETNDLYIDIETWKTESDLEKGDVNSGQSDLMDKSAGDRDKAELFDESWADSGAAGPGVDLRHDAGGGSSIDRRDVNLKGRAVLKEVVDLLANANLGPSGFFIIAHRGL